MSNDTHLYNEYFNYGILSHFDIEINILDKLFLIDKKKFMSYKNWEIRFFLNFRKIFDTIKHDNKLVIKYLEFLYNNKILFNTELIIDNKDNIVEINFILIFLCLLKYIVSSLDFNKYSFKYRELFKDEILLMSYYYPNISHDDKTIFTSINTYEFIDVEKYVDLDFLYLPEEINFEDLPKTFLINFKDRLIFLHQNAINYYNLLYKNLYNISKIIFDKSTLIQKKYYSTFYKSFDNIYKPYLLQNINVNNENVWKLSYLKEIYLAVLLGLNTNIAYTTNFLNKILREINNDSLEKYLEKIKKNNKLYIESFNHYNITNLFIDDDYVDLIDNKLYSYNRCLLSFSNDIDTMQIFSPTTIKKITENNKNPYSNTPIKHIFKKFNSDIANHLFYLEDSFSKKYGIYLSFSNNLDKNLENYFNLFDGYEEVLIYRSAVSFEINDISILS